MTAISMKKPKYEVCPRLYVHAVYLRKFRSTCIYSGQKNYAIAASNSVVFPPAFISRRILILKIIK